MAIKVFRQFVCENAGTAKHRLLNEGTAPEGEVKIGTINKNIQEVEDELQDEYDSFISPCVRIDSAGNVFTLKDDIADYENTDIAQAEALDMYDDSWAECVRDKKFGEFLDYLRTFKPCSKAGKLWQDYQLTYYETMCG